MPSVSNVREHEVCIDKMVILGTSCQEPSHLRGKTKRDVTDRSIAVLKVQITTHQSEGVETEARTGPDGAWLHSKSLRGNHLRLELDSPLWSMLPRRSPVPGG